MSTSSSNERGGCTCHLQLDPLPKGSHSWRNGSDSALDHYCHVCNTQLNSCKQTRIHVNGKRHEKRLIYLKYSLECETRPSESPGNENGSPEYSLPYYQYEPYVLPSFEPSGSYYYSPPPAIVQQSGYYDYHASVPPPVILSHPSPPQSILTLTPSSGTSPGSHHHHHHHHHPGPGNYNIPNNSSTHGVMSPSLTSGFSGSGADCKSTETSSILSAGSFSSNSPSSKPKVGASGASSSSSLSSLTHVHAKAAGGSGGSSSGAHQGRASKKSNSSAKKLAEKEEAAVQESLLKTLSKLVGKGHSCEVCQIAFPSKTVLENHLKGSRHNRKVKSREVFRELQDAGAEFRHSEEEISCEVCKVSVNSSHQLQAHLAGQRHKVRCYRRGLHPSKALLSDFSSKMSSLAPVVGGRNKEKMKSQNRTSHSSSVETPRRRSPASSSLATDPPPLRLSLLGHPGALKTDVSTSLMGAPPLPSSSSTTINLSVSNSRKSKTSKPLPASSNSSRQKLNSQKQKNESEEKKVILVPLAQGDGIPESPALAEPIPIKPPSSSLTTSSKESDKSKINIKENMIIPFKCESCQVAMASPAPPTPVS